MDPDPGVISNSSQTTFISYPRQFNLPPVNAVSNGTIATPVMLDGYTMETNLLHNQFSGTNNHSSNRTTTTDVAYIRSYQHANSNDNSVRFYEKSTEYDSYHDKANRTVGTRYSTYNNNNNIRTQNKKDLNNHLLIERLKCLQAQQLLEQKSAQGFGPPWNK